MKYIFAVLIAVISIQLQAKDAQLKFSDYPVSIFTGKNATMILNKDTRTFRTRFGYLKNEKPNYAGHYVVDTFGCGGGCIAGMAFNVKTGETQFLPFGALSGCYRDGKYIDQDYEYKVESRLLVSTGMHDGDESCSVKYYVEEKGKIKLKKTEYLWK